MRPTAAAARANLQRTLMGAKSKPGEGNQPAPSKEPVCQGQATTFDRSTEQLGHFGRTIKPHRLELCEIIWEEFVQVHCHKRVELAVSLTTLFELLQLSGKPSDSIQWRPSLQMCNYS